MEWKEDGAMLDVEKGRYNAKGEVSNQAEKYDVARRYSNVLAGVLG